MSREVLRELVSALSRLRREAADFERVDQWAGRLEQHLAELEFLAAVPVPDQAEPAFVPVLQASRSGPAQPARPDGAAAPSAITRPSGGAPGPSLSGPPRCGVSVLGILQETASGRRSPTEVVQRALGAARELEGLHVFIEVLEGRARREAAELEEAASASRGEAPDGGPPLRGVPVAVKDLMALEGHVMTGGSRVLDPVPAERDAEAVRRLRARGAVVVGTTNLHELAYGITSENPHFGTVGNPRSPGHIAGGSSGGSAAAVAAGAVPAALGTDTGGSIRIPAAACGVVGLKPTYGRVSRDGVLPLSWSLDHVGPLAATAADAALLFDAMADQPTAEERALARALAALARGEAAQPGLPAPLEAAVALVRSRLQGGDRAPGEREAGLARQALQGLRFALPSDDWMGPLQAPVREAVRRVLERLAGVGVEPSVVRLPSAAALRVAQFVILHAEAASVHRERLRARWERFGEDVRLRLKIGEFLTAVDYLTGQRMRRWLADEMARLLRDVDVLLMPALPVLPPPPGTRTVQVEGEVEPIHRAMTRFTGPFNLTGLPGVVVPVATEPGEGLPVAVQMVGAWGREVDLLRAAIALEWLAAL